MTQRLGAAVETEPWLLSMWATRVAPREALSFSADATRTDDATVWRVTLSGDARSAAQQLAHMETRLAASERALDDATTRMNALLASPATVSFDTMTWPTPERELLSALRADSRRSQPVSFGVGERLDAEWRQLTVQYQRVLTQLEQSVGHYAWVETDVGGQLVARTAIGWLGDMQTVWRDRCAAADRELHGRSLNVALTSRRALVRMVGVTARGAALLVSLPALLTTPVGALIAVPTVWRFVSQVLVEWEQRDTIAPR